MKNCLLCAIMTMMLAGCTWVQLTTEGEGVSLGDALAVAYQSRLAQAYSLAFGG